MTYLTDNGKLSFLFDNNIGYIYIIWNKSIMEAHIKIKYYVSIFSDTFITNSER